MIANRLENSNHPSNFTLQTSCLPPATLNRAVTRPKLTRMTALLRRLPLGVLVLVAAGCGKAPLPPDKPSAIPSAELGQKHFSPETITQGLPWKFSVSTEQSNAAETTRTLFVSSEPLENSGGKTIFLRASLETRKFDQSAQAAEVFAEQAHDAHPDMGLTYAWDLLVLDGTQLHRLHAPCLFSEESFDTMSANLLEMISPATSQVLRCRCGGGCLQTNAADQ